MISSIPPLCLNDIFTKFNLLGQSSLLKGNVIVSILTLGSLAQSNLICFHLWINYIVGLLIYINDKLYTATNANYT